MHRAKLSWRKARDDAPPSPRRSAHVQDVLAPYHLHHCSTFSSVVAGHHSTCVCYGLDLERPIATVIHNKSLSSPEKEIAALAAMRIREKTCGDKAPHNQKIYL